MHDLVDIETLLENPLVMVSAIAFEEGSGTTGANPSHAHKSKTPQVKQNSKPRYVPDALKHP
jgi:hypothetical protein